MLAKNDTQHSIWSACWVNNVAALTVCTIVLRSVLTCDVFFFLSLRCFILWCCPFHHFDTTYMFWIQKNCSVRPACFNSCPKMWSWWNTYSNRLQTCIWGGYKVRKKKNTKRTTIHKNLLGYWQRWNLQGWCSLRLYHKLAECKIKAMFPVYLGGRWCCITNPYSPSATCHYCCK